MKVKLNRLGEKERCIDIIERYNKILSDPFLPIELKQSHICFRDEYIKRLHLLTSAEKKNGKSAI